MAFPHTFYLQVLTFKALTMSKDHFQQALDARDVEEVRRCLEINRFLVNKPIVVVLRCRTTYPPLVYVVSNHKLSDSVSELVELVRVLLDHKADIYATDWIGWSALRYAVCKNLVEVVELLLQYQAQVSKWSNSGVTALFNLLIAHGPHGPDVNSKDDNGGTPLFYAKSVEVARLLIAHGAEVNSKDNAGYTPLSLAENAELAYLLIAYGADVNDKNNDGYPAWLRAMQKHWDLETLKVLVEHGADLQGEDGIHALHRATEGGPLELMEFLIDQGVPVNAKVTEEVETPLHVAVRRGWVPGVQLLLRRGADVNATNHYGKTPLAYIRPSRQAPAMEVAELFIEHVVAEGKNVLTIFLDVHPQLRRYMMERTVYNPKVDLNARVSADGDTLAFDMIDKLCKKVDLYRPIFMLLIEYGADVTAKYHESGRTLLHFAAAGSNLMETRYNEVEFHSEVQLLLEKGSDVNAIDSNGFTPLLYASYHGHWKIVRILVDHGADVNIAHKDHGTPLLMACKMNEESTVQLLLDAGAHVDGRSKNGVTSLQVCAGKGLVECATLLLNRGADIHAANQKGCTPFLEACRRQRPDVIYCLLRSSSHQGRLGLVSEMSYPSSARSTTVAECEDGCYGLVNLFHDDSDADVGSGDLK